MPRRLSERNIFVSRVLCCCSDTGRRGATSSSLMGRCLTLRRECHATQARSCLTGQSDAFFCRVCSAAAGTNGGAIWSSRRDAARSWLTGAMSSACVAGALLPCPAAARFAPPHGSTLSFDAGAMLRHSCKNAQRRDATEACLLARCCSIKPHGVAGLCQGVPCYPVAWRRDFVPLHGTLRPVSGVPCFYVARWRDAAPPHKAMRHCSAIANARFPRQCGAILLKLPSAG